MMSAANRRKASPARHVWAAVVIGLSLLAGACAAMLDPGPPPVRLQLKPAVAASEYGYGGKGQVIVAVPVAGREVDTDGIALVFHEREVRYLAGARWTNTAPQLLQRFTIDALEASGAFAGVGDEVGGFMADARLTSDLRAFSLYYADAKAAPVARFAAVFRVMDLRSGAMLGTRTVETQAAATSTDNAALARAMEEALAKALRELTPWVVELMPAKKR